MSDVFGMLMAQLHQLDAWLNTTRPDLRWLYTAFRIASWVGSGLLFISLFRLWRAVPRQGWFVVAMLPAFVLFLYYTEQIWLASRTLNPTYVLMIFNGSLATFFLGIARLNTKFLPAVEEIVRLSEKKGG